MELSLLPSKSLSALPKSLIAAVRVRFGSKALVDEQCKMSARLSTADVTMPFSIATPPMSAIGIKRPSRYWQSSAATFHNENYVDSNFRSKNAAVFVAIVSMSSALSSNKFLRSQLVSATKRQPWHAAP